MERKNRQWIKWQLTNAGADVVTFGQKTITVALRDGWSKAAPYTNDRSTVITLTRAIRDHKAGK